MTERKPLKPATKQSSPEYYKCPKCHAAVAYGQWRRKAKHEGFSTCPKCKTVVKDTTCRKCVGGIK